MNLVSKVYHMHNCLFLQNMPTKKIDFVYDDPPYAIGESNKNHKSRNTAIKQKNGNKLKAKDNCYVSEDWDNKAPSDQYFNHLFRTSKVQVIWGGNYFKQLGIPFKTPRRNDFLQFIKDYPIGWILWDKVNSTNDFNDCELAWTNTDKPSVIIQFMWNGMMQGKSITEGTMQQGNKKLNEKRIHPTQKPMAINRWIFHNYLPKDIINPVVYDGHVGSGGSRITAHEYNCHFIGCETSLINFNNQEKRFTNYISQIKIQF